MRECVRCRRNRNEKFFTPRGKVCVPCRKAGNARTTKARRLRMVYDISLPEYEAISEYQGHVCGACGEKRAYLLHVDHDHRLEKLMGVRASIRGLLCKRCNKLLRDLRDNIPLARALINYLQDPPARRVLQ